VRVQCFNERAVARVPQVDVVAHARHYELIALGVEGRKCELLVADLDVFYTGRKTKRLARTFLFEKIIVKVLNEKI
jgi:hypothetical protein